MLVGILHYDPQLRTPDPVPGGRHVPCHGNKHFLAIPAQSGGKSHLPIKIEVGQIFQVRFLQVPPGA